MLTNFHRGWYPDSASGTCGDLMSQPISSDVGSDRAEGHGVDIAASGQDGQTRRDGAWTAPRLDPAGTPGDVVPAVSAQGRVHHGDVPVADARPARSPAVSPAGPAIRRRRSRMPLLVLLLLGAGIAGLLVWHPWAVTAPATPAAHGGAAQSQAVGVATAAPGDVAITLTELGTVTPLATVTVRTQIAGILTQVAFTEGQMVRRGDFLAQVDPRPYQALLEQAEGTLARDQAILANAQLDLARYQKLNSQDSIARQTVDTSAATVRQDQGIIRFDQAAIDTQKLNLAYCHITSPVEGRVGLRQVDQGNYVTTGDANGLVVVTTLQPISVIFTLPEDSIPAVQKRTGAGASLPVAAWDRGDVARLADGTLLTLDTQIDPTTGTVKARASFPNQDLALFPQQFVNAHLLVDTLHAPVLVPNAAVQRGSPGTFVYLVGADDTVAVRKVAVGPADNSSTAITSGLAAGDRVVVDGADRLHEGAKVTVPADHPQPAAGEPAPEHRHRHGQ
jgi:multidrug efflux system membrane fusion protein